MANTMNFLLDYYQYINNIDNLSHIDDLKINCEFIKQKLVEGLIHTYPTSKSVNIISNRFTELTCAIEDDGEIYIEGNFKELHNYLPLFNNLGYFIAKLTFDGDKWIKEHTEDSKPLALFLEPKYDTIIEPIPDILYHTSNKKFDKRISNIGLAPKTSNKLSNYPERIYLTNNIEFAIQFGESQHTKIKLNNDEMQSYYSIYKIDGIGVNKLYQDLNSKPYGYYTLDNIDNKYITKIK